MFARSCSGNQDLPNPYYQPKSPEVFVVKSEENQSQNHSEDPPTASIKVEETDEKDESGKELGIDKAEAEAEAEESYKTSATLKALKKMKGEEEVKKLHRTKSGKISNKFKRQRLNERFIRLLTPKNALNLLNEIKPSVSYTVKEIPSGGNINSGGFFVQARNGKDVLGNGQGISKSQAKNVAAENAIKFLFSKAVKAFLNGELDSLELEEGFPWAGLAQFAMHKMFNDWQLQGEDLPKHAIDKYMSFAKNSKKSPVNSCPTKKNIPADAHNLHPMVLLNNLYPGLQCIELERTLTPESRVKIAFELDGKQYCGVSSNKKEAKKEAAKVLLSTLYGIKYES